MKFIQQKNIESMFDVDHSPVDFERKTIYMVD